MATKFLYCYVHYSPSSSISCETPSLFMYDLIQLNLFLLPLYRNTKLCASNDHFKVELIVTSNEVCSVLSVGSSDVFQAEIIFPRKWEGRRGSISISLENPSCD